jgi:hypothetical protein
MSADPLVLSTWSRASVHRTDMANVALYEFSPKVAIFRAGPMDEELAARVSKKDLASQTLSAQVKSLRQYSHDYREAAAKLAGAQARAPTVPLEILAQWAGFDDARRQRSARRLQTLWPLANLIEKNPLHAQMAAIFRREPFSIVHVNHGLTVLQDYLAMRHPSLAIFRPTMRREAKKATRYFNQKLRVKSAQRVREFLQGVRMRQDFLAELENELVVESLGALPGDLEMLRVFRQHCMAAAATVSNTPRGAVSAEVPFEIVHRLMLPEIAQAADILQEWKLPPGPKSADRLAIFLARLQARLQITEWWNHVQPSPGRAMLPSDAELERALYSHQQTFDFVLAVFADPDCSRLRRPVSMGMRNPVLGWQLIQALRRSYRGQTA